MALKFGPEIRLMTLFSAKLMALKFGPEIRLMTYAKAQYVNT